MVEAKKEKGKWDSSDEEDDSEIDKRKKRKVGNVESEITASNAKPGDVDQTSQDTLPSVENASETLSNTQDALIDDAVSMQEDPVCNGNSPKPPDGALDNEEPAVIIEEATAIAANSAKIVEKYDHNPLHHGCRSVDEYIRLNFIDQGTYGVVFRARCKRTGKIYALKQVKIGKEAAKVGFPVTALRETNILLALKHPNIVRVREMVVGTNIDKVYMVMDFGGMDLKACMDKAKKPFSTSEVKQLMIQFLSAVDHMHDKCPIAPYTFEVVTLWYRPTELLLGKREYSTPLDLWAVGCIFAEMLTGRPLFPGEGEIDQINKIFKMLGAPSEDQWPGVMALPFAGKISWKQPTRGKLRDLFPTASFSGGVYLNDTGYDLLTKFLTMDPAQRISAADALRHPWLTTEAPLPTSLDMMPRVKSRSQEIEEEAEEAERERKRKESLNA